MKKGEAFDVTFCLTKAEGYQKINLIYLLQTLIFIKLDHIHLLS